MGTESKRFVEGVYEAGTATKAAAPFNHFI